MLADSEIRIWYFQSGLSPKAQELIEKIRTSPPQRSVYGGRKNVSGRYPSRKMGQTIQFESHRVELARIYQHEFDPNVLEYYDQPYGGVELSYKSKKGRSVRQVYTPDFFVIRENKAGWEECKTEEELHKLAEVQPNRYYRDESGTWRCPPGEEYAARFGLYFHVWSDAEVSWEYQENLICLDEYRRPDCPDVVPTVLAAVHKLLEEERGISLADLLIADTGATADDIYTLIATQQIYVDLYRARLSHPQDVEVFLNQEIALAYGHALQVQQLQQPDGFQKITISIGLRLNWDGEVWEIINTGHDKTSLQGSDGHIVSLANEQLDALIEKGEVTAVQKDKRQGEQSEAVSEILRQTKPEDLEKAHQRYQAIQDYLGLDAPACPSKKLRRWKNSYLAAEAKYGNGFVGLIPRHRFQGNHSLKISLEIMEYVKTYIQKHYQTIKQRSINSVYKSFKHQFREDHPDWDVVGRTSFYNVVKKLSGPKQTRSREGRRAAIQKEPVYDELTLKTPRHGSRPFEIAHIDHTPMDIELISSLESLSLCNVAVEKLSKPQELANQAWLTLMIDAYSRKILAVYVTYESPSYRSCMMVMRDCVRRFKRLPQTIVADNGSDFRSNYFAQLLAAYEITPKYRPPAYARFGTLVERMFGVNNQEFLYNLQGNTQGRKNRQTTKSVDPKRNAIWNLPDLYNFLCEWLYDVYDNRHHPALGQSPNDAFTSGLAIGGQREHRRIEYDEVFKILTLPAPKPETRKIQEGKGIKISNIWYSCDSFRDPTTHKEKVKVRYDPFNIGIAYAFVKKQWVECRSSYYTVFNGRSEKEIQLASEEVKKRKRVSGKTVEVSDREIAQFLESVEDHEALLKQQLKAIDNQAILRVINGGLTACSDPSPDEDTYGSHLRLVSDTDETEEPDLGAIQAETVEEDEEEFEIYGDF